MRFQTRRKQEYLWKPLYGDRCESPSFRTSLSSAQGNDAEKIEPNLVNVLLQCRLYEINLKMDLVYWPLVRKGLIGIATDFYSMYPQNSLESFLKSKITSVAFLGLENWLGNQPVLLSWIRFSSNLGLYNQLMSCYKEICREIVLESITNLFHQYLYQDWIQIQQIFDFVVPSLLSDIVEIFWIAKAESLLIKLPFKKHYAAYNRQDWGIPIEESRESRLSTLCKVLTTVDI